MLCEGTMNKGNEELEPIIIRDMKLGSWNSSMVKKIEENVIQIFFLEKHNVYIVCNEKMAMECRQVNMGEHEGE